MITILKAIAIKDEQASTVKRTQEDIHNAFEELGTVRELAQYKIPQAQGFQENTAKLSSRISQKKKKGGGVMKSESRYRNGFKGNEYRNSSMKR